MPCLGAFSLSSPRTRNGCVCVCLCVCLAMTNGLFLVRMMDLPLTSEPAKPVMLLPLPRLLRKVFERGKFHDAHTGRNFQPEKRDCLL